MKGDRKNETVTGFFFHRRHAQLANFQFKIFATHSFIEFVFHTRGEKNLKGGSGLKITQTLTVLADFSCNFI